MARRSSRFSRSRALIRSRSSLVSPLRRPASTSVRPGRIERILNAGLLLLQLGLGSGPDLNDGHPAGQLRQTLLELLAVVVGGRVIDLRAELVTATPRCRTSYPRPDDGRVVTIEHDARRSTQVLQRDVLELDLEILADALSRRVSGDVPEAGLPSSCRPAPRPVLPAEVFAHRERLLETPFRRAASSHSADLPVRQDLDLVVLLGLQQMFQLQAPPPPRSGQVRLSPAKSGYKRSTRCGAASRGRDRFAPDSPHRQAGCPISTGPDQRWELRSCTTLLMQSDK